MTARIFIIIFFLLKFLYTLESSLTNPLSFKSLVDVDELNYRTTDYTVFVISEPCRERAFPETCLADNHIQVLIVIGEKAKIQPTFFTGFPENFKFILYFRKEPQTSQISEDTETAFYISAVVISIFDIVKVFISSHSGFIPDREIVIESNLQGGKQFICIFYSAYVNRIYRLGECMEKRFGKV